MAETQAHHGVTVSDLEAMTAAIGAIGFTAIEGDASEPRNYRNEPGDAIGQMIAPTLGNEIRTWFIENPATGQQLEFLLCPLHAVGLAQLLRQLVRQLDEIGHVGGGVVQLSWPQRSARPVGALLVLGQGDAEVPLGERRQPYRRVSQ